MELSYLFAPITKSAKDDAGDLIVYGKLTGPELDHDGQICDPSWLKTAVPAWFEVGNIREMHQPKAVGKASELEQSGDDWYISAKIVDRDAIHKVEEGILNGFSIGIKGPRLVKDIAAPNGRIVGGRIVESSLADAPCNPTCKLSLAKSVGAGEQVTVPDGAQLADVFDVERELVKDETLEELADLSKTEWTTAFINGLPDSSFAYVESGVFPSSSFLPTPRLLRHFPFKDAAGKVDLPHLRNALSRAPQSPFGAKAMPKLKAAAKTAGVGDEADKVVSALLTKALTGDKADGDDGGDELPYIQAAVDAIATLIQLEAAELPEDSSETYDIDLLICALRALREFWFSEARSGEVPDPETVAQTNELQEDDMEITLTQVADLMKAATADDAADDAKNTVVDLVKALAPAMRAELLPTGDEKFVTTSEMAEATKALTERVAKAEQLAAPGPVRTRSNADVAQEAHTTLKTDIEEWRSKADMATDPDVRKGYLQRAAEAERALATQAKE